MKTSTFFLLFATMVLALAVSCSAKPRYEFSPTFDSDDVPETQLPPVPGHIRGDRSASAGRRRQVHVVEHETVSDDNPCKVQCMVDFFSCKSLALFNKESLVAPCAADIKAFREELKKCRDAKDGCFNGCSRFDA